MTAPDVPTPAPETPKLTLAELKELLDDLYHEIDNQGGREGDLYERAYKTLRFLVHEYLRASEDDGS